MRAITIRFPEDLATDAQAESKSSGESINQFVLGAVADAVERRRARRALDRMSKRLDVMRSAGRVVRGSEPLIREFREGSGRRG
jgi:hypothetical protein